MSARSMSQRSGCSEVVSHRELRDEGPIALRVRHRAQGPAHACEKPGQELLACNERPGRTSSPPTASKSKIMYVAGVATLELCQVVRRARGNRVGPRDRRRPPSCSASLGTCRATAAPPTCSFTSSAGATRPGPSSSRPTSPSSSGPPCSTMPRASEPSSVASLSTVTFSTLTANPGARGTPPDAAARTDRPTPRSDAWPETSSRPRVRPARIASTCASLSLHATATPRSGGGSGRRVAWCKRSFDT